MGISTLLANRTVVLVVVAASGDKVPMGVAQVGTYDAVDTRLPSPPETFTGMHGVIGRLLPLGAFIG